jgi:rubrerythrin
MEQSTEKSAGLIAELNDLMRLDHDAVQAYTLAIRELSSESHQAKLRDFRREHENHISELSDLIRQHGGLPVQLPHEAGAFKLALQGMAGLGNDVAVLRAFRANERQVRDKYARFAAKEYPEDVSFVLRRNAADEERHYEWADTSLREMGHEPGVLEDGFGKAHQRLADAYEATERGAMRFFERGRRTASEHPAATIAGAALVVVAAGELIRRAMK